MSNRSNGVSFEFSVSSEDIEEVVYATLNGSVGLTISPPDIADGLTSSKAMDMWVQSWPHWNYQKISEPKYDGFAAVTGIPSNKPDLIKDYHMIGLMRNVDEFLKPDYSSNILSMSTSTTPIPPASK
jgi:hypothetical protein